MNFLRKHVERFCYRHPRFGVPKLMLALALATGAVYLISLMDRSGVFLSVLAFEPVHILKGEVWRLISWMILPSTWSFWLLIALYFYYFIGSTLENVWGAGRFTVFYLLGALLHVIVGFLLYFVFGWTLYLHPYYLNMSMFFAFATLFPEQRVLLFFILPIKVKWLAVADALLIFVPAIVQAVTGNWPVLLLPVSAVVNYFVFCGSDLKRYLSRGAAAASNVVSFKKAAATVKKQAVKKEEKPYRHKCSVCGRTDTDHPDLEFRYCSRCEGYHCFCSEHINNHVHFTR